MKISKALQKIIAEFAKHGYYFDEIGSYRGYYRFAVPAAPGATWFSTQKEMREYLDNVCW